MGQLNFPDKNNVALVIRHSPVEHSAPAAVTPFKTDVYSGVKTASAGFAAAMTVMVAAPMMPAWAIANDKPKTPRALRNAITDGLKGSVFAAKAVRNKMLPPRTR